MSRTTGAYIGVLAVVVHLLHKYARNPHVHLFTQVGLLVPVVVLSALVFFFAFSGLTYRACSLFTFTSCPLYFFLLLVTFVRVQVPVPSVYILCIYARSLCRLYLFEPYAL